MKAAWRRGVVGVAAVAVVVGAFACDEKKRPRRDDDDDDGDRPRRATASASASSSGEIATSASAATSVDTPGTATAEGTGRPDPVVTKTFRARACRYGALAFRQTRDAYVSSLKGGPPSASNIPSFAGGSSYRATPSTTSSSSPLTPARVYPPRYEVFTRQCNSATSVRDAADPALDAALKDFSSFASPLAKILGEAANYYGKDDYKSDAFAKGKEFHACLTGTGTCTVSGRMTSGSSNTVTRGFEQLDGKIAKLALALEQYEASHPIDKSKYADGQKASAKLVGEATAVLMAIDAGASGKPLTDAVARAEAVLAELKAFEGKDPPETWSKAVVPMAEVFLKKANEIAKKTPDAVTDHEVFELVQSYTRMLEKDFSALQMSLRAGSSLTSRKLGPRLPPGHPRGMGSADEEPDPP